MNRGLQSRSQEKIDLGLLRNDDNVNHTVRRKSRKAKIDRRLKPAAHASAVEALG